MSFEAVNIELFLYTFQQFISRSLYLNFYLQKPIFFLLLFLSGILASVNPCMISMIPISLSQLYFDSNKKKHLFSFLYGLSSSSILFILTFAILNYKYHQFFIGIPLLSNFVPIVLGLFLLKILQVQPTLEFTILNNNPYIKNYILGFLLGINTSSCSTPILLTLLYILFSSNNYILFSIYTTIYIGGYIFFLLLILFIIQIGLIKSTLFTFASNIINRWSGCILLSFGILRLLENAFA